MRNFSSSSPGSGAHVLDQPVQGNRLGGKDRRRVIVATPDPGQRARLARIVAAIPEFTVCACSGDLMNTYIEVEERLPKAVLIADVLADLPEFEVMRALFSALDVRWLVVATRTGNTFSTPRGEGFKKLGSDLFAISANASEEEIASRLLSLTNAPKSTGRPDTNARARKPTEAKPRAEKRVQTASPEKPRFVGHATPNANGSSGRDEALVLIGASTGGVDALLSVLKQFPADCPPTLIVQHTGNGFGASLAALLNRQCRAAVSLVEGTDRLRNGHVVIGAGCGQHLVLKDDTAQTFGFGGGDPVSGHVPSVDSLFRSALPRPNTWPQLY